MPKKSAENDIIRKAAKDISPPSGADLDRLRNAMKGKIDTTEISETRSFNRLERDATGALPRRSMIRDAIETQRKRHHLTVYRLWRKATEFHPSLSQAAVHEFLKGQRQLELPSAEALIAAVGLRFTKVIVVRRKARRSTKARSRTYAR
jgi:hypothetical protein